MAYTDQQIADYARKLGAAGAKPEEIEAFVASAKGSKPAEQPVPAAHANDPESDFRSFYKNTYGLDMPRGVLGGDAAKELASQGGAIGGAIRGAQAGAGRGPAGAALGAALGAAMAYGATRLAQGDPATPGELAQAAALAPVPSGQAMGGVVRSALQAGVQSSAADAVRRAIDEGRMSSVGEAVRAASLPALVAGAFRMRSPDGPVQTVKDTVRNRNIREFIKEGGAVVPSDIEPSLTNRVLDTVGNRANVARKALLMNDATAVKMAKREIGIPADREITSDSVSDAFASAAKKFYEPVASISAQAADAIKQRSLAKTRLGNARAVLSDPTNKTPANVQELADAELAMQKADADLATAAGPAGLKSIQDGDTLWAKINDVWDATNKGTGSLDPSKIGRTYNETEKLSGDLEKIGAFNKAAGSAVSREASNVPQGWIGRLSPTFGAGVGFSAGGVPGMILGGAAPVAAEEIARRYQLSRARQSRLAQPTITRAPGQGDELLARVARAIGLEN